MELQNFPVIKTERLTLRKIVESDSDVILFLRSDKAINKFIERPESRMTRNIADAIRHINETHLEIENNRAIAWGITINDHPKIVGTIGLWQFSEDHKTAEVGYDLNTAFHRKGIMSEALNAVVNFGFAELALEMIEAFTHVQNENSKGLLLKNGFNLMEDRKDDDNLFNVIFEIRNPAVEQ